MPAWAENWTNSWEDIQRESAKVSSLNAGFTQSKHMKILTTPLVSQGRFYFQAPDAIRWEYSSPVKSILLTSGQGIRRYTQGSTGLIETTSDSLQSMQVILKEIGQWSKGRFTTNPYFSAVLKGGEDPQIIMTPKEEGLAAMIERIVIAPAPDRPGILRSVKIVESEGNYTLFEFSDIRVNGKIPESIFREVE
ncbi:MAG: outer membrane lipoprotein carrier protein LolA [Syntrophales bacterium]|nr:outer membrane lipoprotein carrier protein LolA [Syntrophales bacterium]